MKKGNAHYGSSLLRSPTWLVRLPGSALPLWLPCLLLVSGLPACSSADFSVSEPLTVDPTIIDQGDGGSVSEGGGADVALDSGRDSDSEFSDRSDGSGDSSGGDIRDEVRDVGEERSVIFCHHPPLGPDYEDDSVAPGVPGDVSTYPQALVDNSIAHVKASEPPADYTDGPIPCPGLSDPCTTTVEKPHGGVPWTAITWCRDGSGLVLTADALPECPSARPTLALKWW